MKSLLQKLLSKLQHFQNIKKLMLDVSFQLQIFSSSLYGKPDIKHENCNAKISSDSQWCTNICFIKMNPIWRVWYYVIMAPLSIYGMNIEKNITRKDLL